MERYDYEQAVREDLAEYIRDRAEAQGWDADELRRERDSLYDDAFVADSVTGNGSGSYTFSTWQAEENICHNSDLMQEVVEEFGAPDSDKMYNAEFWDVSIRCLMLGCVFDDVLKEVLSEMEPKGGRDTKGATTGTGC